jgi:hypothetical protein
MQIRLHQIIYCALKIKCNRGPGAVAEVMTRPAQAFPARSGRHRARPHEGPGAVAEVASARVDEMT